MDSSTYGPLISGFGNATHLKRNSALVDFANQIGLSACYKALETEDKLLFDMNYSKENVEKPDMSLLKQLQLGNIDVRKSINWLRVLGMSIEYHGKLLTAKETAGLYASI